MKWLTKVLENASRTEKNPRLATLGGFNHPDMREAICSNIRANLSLHGDGVAVIGNKKDALLVKWTIDNEYVPRTSLWLAVHEGICQVGRSMFEWHRANPLGNYPDHALSPEALGYAMIHGAITYKEIASIHFDHGETPEKYVRCAEGLLEKVIHQLEAGTAFFDLSALDEGDGFFCR